MKFSLIQLVVFVAVMAIISYAVGEGLRKLKEVDYFRGQPDFHKGHFDAPRHDHS